TNEHGHLYQWADNAGESLSAVNAEHTDGYRNGQFKIIAGGGKGDGCISGIIRPEAFGDKEADEEHQAEIDDQGNGYTYDVERDFNNEFAFYAEHNHDGEQQRRKGNGGNKRHEFLFEPLLAFQPDKAVSADHTHQKGNTQVDTHTFGDFSHRDIHHRSLDAE